VLLQKKRAVIFVNGEAGNLHRLASMLLPNDYLIAADGGLHHLMQIKKWPQDLIGDLDSVLPEEIEQARLHGVTITRYPVKKNETDLQLAIDLAVKANCTQIILAAAAGGRLDQTLANLFLLFRPDLQLIDVKMDDGIEEVFLIQQSKEIFGAAGDIVSLVPILQPAKGVKTENLRYPLDFETLNPDQTRGISNVMETKTARVSLSEGCLICIHTRK
jgi:thiamine pyrophosphokinase